MQVEWRRAKVLELLSKGDSQSEIASRLVYYQQRCILSKAAG